LDFIDPAIRKHYESFGCDLECVGYKGATGFETPWSPVGGRIDFLENLYKLINDFDVIAVAEVSSTFFYALALSKQLYITANTGETLWWVDKKPRKIPYNNLETLINVEFDIDSIPLENLILPTLKLLHFALKELGWDFANDSHNSLLNKRYHSKMEFLAELS
jgi:hypothetical protein